MPVTPAQMDQLRRAIDDAVNEMPVVGPGPGPAIAPPAVGRGRGRGHAGVGHGRGLPEAS